VLKNTAVETLVGAHEVVEMRSTARVIGSRSCRPRLPPSGAGIEVGSDHLAQLAERRLGTVLYRGPMPTIAAAIKKAAQLKALPDWELVEDESQRRAVGRARHALDVRQVIEKTRPDALQQLQVLSG